jgi:acyl-CoA thioester hydrolase
LRQEVRRGDELLVSAVVHVATVRRGRAVRVPDALRSALGH